MFIIIIISGTAAVLQTRLRLTTSAPSQYARSKDTSVHSISHFVQCAPSTAHRVLHASHCRISPLTSGFCTGANSWRGLVGGLLRGKPQVVKLLNWLWLC
eukprot:739987-Prorocentrum_minimum.AAC.1